MDVKKFIQDQTRKKTEDHEKYMKRIEQDRQETEMQKQILETRSDIPDKTGVIETLNGNNGKTVIIITKSRGLVGAQSDKCTLDFDPQSLRVLIKDIMSTPLIGEDYVLSIIDAENGEIIYNNPYELDSIPLQKAKILGKTAGIEECSRKIDSLNSQAEYEERDFAGALRALDRIPEYIQQGEGLIYPQQKNDWEECVCYRASDLYHGRELENALEVMKALEEGKSLDEVKKLISEGHSGNSYAMLCSIIREFSKRGVEFTRELSNGYEYTMKHGTEEQKKEWTDCLKQIEERNAKYEEELASGAFGK